MADGDSWNVAFLRGLAEHLAANGIGTWRPDGPYTAGETGIAIRSIPPAPDRIITLASYPVSTGPTNLADFTVGVQFRIRGTGNPDTSEDIASALFELLDSSGRQTWGTAPNEVVIVDAWQQSYGALGNDAQGRWEASVNYYIQAMRPTIHRND